MHRLLWTLLISSLLMLGCSPDKKPDEGIKEAQENTWAKSTADLQVYSEDLENTIAAKLDKFCWEREEEDNCDLSPSNPRTENLLEGRSPLIVKKGETIPLYHDYLTVGIPKPDEFSVTQYSLNDEVGVQIEVIEEEHERPKIITPDEPGRYYYTVHIQWHEEAVGESYYAFSLHVKEDS